VTKTLFRAIAPAAVSVAAAMGRVNRELARDNERAMFVTAFAARLDVATGELEYVNAGHNPTYRVDAGGGVAPLGGTVNPALGAVEGHEYQAMASIDGTRNTAVPTMSSHSLPRSGRCV